MNSPSSDPAAEYGARLNRARAQRTLLEKKSIRLGNFRLAIALLAAVFAWLAWGQHTVSPLFLLVPAIAFLGLVVWHQSVIRQRRFADRAVRYYEEGIARIHDAWAGTGSTGDTFRSPDHVYADDLDVFGHGSLFQLISRARTAIGEATLAQWLLAPATSAVAEERQHAVQELAAGLDLRENIALLTGEIGSGIHAEALIQWAQAGVLPVSSMQRLFALLLSAAGLLAGIATIAGRLPLFVFLLIFIADVVFLVMLRKPLASAVASMETPAADLDLLSLVIARLEKEPFTAPTLARISQSLRTDGTLASRRISQLRRWVEILDSSDHFIIRVLDPVLLWRAQVTMAIERWRQINGSQVTMWLTAVGDFEALSSLAGLRYERPAWILPTLQPDGAHPRVIAQALKHPLLPAARAIGNDVELGDAKDLLIISGSNMSGKSTLLRAIGLNCVLAWAGAPVFAEQLTLTPLQVAASLRVTDSLQDNRSRFMAEITRLRSIVALTDQPLPVLFLLDELLSGTNSHDRRIGATAIVRSLLASNAIGLLTTHDLALSALEAELGERAANAHFQDTIVAGTMQFDYQLHPGVVTRSNALELMRAVGLPV